MAQAFGFGPRSTDVAHWGARAVQGHKYRQAAGQVNANRPCEDAPKPSAPHADTRKSPPLPEPTVEVASVRGRWRRPGHRTRTTISQAPHSQASPSASRPAWEGSWPCHPPGCRGACAAPAPSCPSPHRAWALDHRVPAGPPRSCFPGGSGRTGIAWPRRATAAEARWYADCGACGWPPRPPRPQSAVGASSSAWPSAAIAASLSGRRRWPDGASPSGPTDRFPTGSWVHTTRTGENTVGTTPPSTACARACAAYLFHCLYQSVVLILRPHAPLLFAVTVAAAAATTATGLAQRARGPSDCSRTSNRTQTREPHISRDAAKPLAAKPLAAHGTKDSRLPPERPRPTLVEALDWPLDGSAASRLALASGTALVGATGSLLEALGHVRAHVPRHIGHVVVRARDGRAAVVLRVGLSV
eukprot:scaffold207_cov409-Prasinococcus_capsulatus_cf.AAC.4